jgi:hypothetical protein
MENVDELSGLALSALKEIRQTGRATNRTMAQRLLSDAMIVGSRDGNLRLTAKGRRVLMRGFARTLG